MEKVGTIYCLQFPNGKTYIGQTWNFPRRMREHKRSSTLIKKYPLNHAINKYGWENIEINILNKELKTQEEMNTCELYYTNIYYSRVCENGYNTKEPGSRGAHTEETKKKIKNSNILSVTEERRKKMKERVSGNKNPMFGKNGDKNPMFGVESPNKGKKHTMESRKKMSEAAKLRWSKRNV